MPKYRKRPVVIEAEQWFPGMRIDGVVEGTDEVGDGENRTREFGIIKTLEGPMRVDPGDWVITGVDGEKYPCKPDIFEKTYEPAE